MSAPPQLQQIVPLKTYAKFENSNPTLTFTKNL